MANDKNIKDPVELASISMMDLERKFSKGVLGPPIAPLMPLNLDHIPTTQPVAPRERMRKTPTPASEGLLGELSPDMGRNPNLPPRER